MKVVFPERVSMTLYRYRFFELGLTQVFLETVKPGMNVFDIGAHFGYYSLLASTLVGPKGSVHAFEPTPSTFKVLTQNAAGKPDIRVNNLALWSSSKTLHFRDYGVTHSAFNSVGDGAIHDYMAEGIEPTSCEVTATTIDQYVADAGVAPHFIKLDAEGAESEIIEGMKQTLEQLRPILTLEIGGGSQDQAVRSRSTLEKLLAKNYAPFTPRNGKITPYDPATAASYNNVLLLPQ